jgi:hypothetical protein
MPGWRVEPGSEEVSFCTGTDQPVAPTAVAAKESSVKTWVSSELAEEAIGEGDSSASVALSIPKGALHFEQRRESGELLVWHDGHSTIKSTALRGALYYPT